MTWSGSVSVMSSCHLPFPSPMPSIFSLTIVQRSFWRQIANVDIAQLNQQQPTATVEEGWWVQRTIPSWKIVGRLIGNAVPVRLGAAKRTVGCRSHFFLRRGFVEWASRTGR